ncbi:hypothetical protein ES332_D05G342300v1 [Gossypium tomentosum]|uniref:Transmembrane protein n=1 Tax=Gossypium tomentosum TaxID=34277 RepID=A0A5D2L6A2_GOSTO|nr:hypothetical protein ES332_D05G342300v1 [Gossypium tomentosum]
MVTQNPKTFILIIIVIIIFQFNHSTVKSLTASDVARHLISSSVLFHVNSTAMDSPTKIPICYCGYPASLRTSPNITHMWVFCMFVLVLCFWVMNFVG